jgi:DNA-binding response OmpR family regulator
MSAHLLVIEDDPALLFMLEAALSYGGFTSKSAKTGREGIDAFNNERFDGVLMDLGLPDFDGGELLRTLRNLSDMPIIVVSGRGTEQDKVEALDLGADDFVPKPFLPGELLARIRAALRRSAPLSREDASSNVQRMQSRAAEPIAIGALILNPTERRLELNGRSIPLTEGEYTVMRVLAANIDATVPKQAILEALYGQDDARETKIVDVYISRLRQKLRQMEGGDDLIHNFRGRGWSLRTPE